MQKLYQEGFSDAKLETIGTNSYMIHMVSTVIQGVPKKDDRSLGMSEN